MNFCESATKIHEKISHYAFVEEVTKTAPRPNAIHSDFLCKHVALNATQAKLDTVVNKAASN